MFNAMSALLSSLARRVMPLRRRKSLTSSGFVAIRRPFFPCGAGHRDVSDDSPYVVIKRGTLMRKVMRPRRVCERKRGRGDDGKDGGDEPCVWQRTILLGRRCQPLEFAGAIHYDGEGQRLWQPRTPPQSSPLPRSPVHPSELGYMDRA
ncbi:hypothetical protein BAE44_0001694 [Dichanthelium oligosanthes]|uniref:Uncharacterized protein n=1 Tax=Dichanthelium oligosanthes TaxID=888268 RepID=A0A1E5WIR2_9POAL|nr:hypothetical protein BAE44_0001694 [Dichanthelium oligosanthes]